MIDVTDSELLAVPGGEYAVLRRIREVILARPLLSGASHGAPVPAPCYVVTPPTHWGDLPPAQDPWARPAWDSETLFLPAVTAA